MLSQKSIKRISHESTGKHHHIWVSKTNTVDCTKQWDLQKFTKTEKKLDLPKQKELYVRENLIHGNRIRSGLTVSWERKINTWNEEE